MLPALKTVTSLVPECCVYPCAGIAKFVSLSLTVQDALRAPVAPAACSMLSMLGSILSSALCVPTKASANTTAIRHELAGSNFH
uniref:Uncharacterized protein n=1 Tax=Trichuris muris TaxID=70415 RepID=A0A5S6QR97_TRIMR